MALNVNEEAANWYRLVSLAFALLVLPVPEFAGDIARGLTITGGENALATLKLKRVHDKSADNGLLTLRVSVGQTRDVKGYGFSLAYDPSRYGIVNAREADGKLLKSGTGRETLFLASDRTPGRVDIGAVRVDRGSTNGGLSASVLC